MKKVTLIMLTKIFLVSCDPSSTTSFFETVEVSERMNRIELKVHVPPYFFPQEIKITVVGDSLTRGYGSEDQRGYLTYLEDSLLELRGVSSVNFDNFGIVGQTSSSLLEKLEEESVQKSIQDAHLIVITTGGNDIMNIARRNLMNLQIEPFLDETKKYESNLIKIFEKVEELNQTATILLVGVYNPFATLFPNIKELEMIITSWNATGKAVCYNIENCYFVGIADIFAEEPLEFLYDDFFHPNDAGYQKIAEQIFETIQLKIEPNESNDWFVPRKEEVLWGNLHGRKPSLPY